MPVFKDDKIVAVALGRGGAFPRTSFKKYALVALILCALSMAAAAVLLRNPSHIATASREIKRAEGAGKVGDVKQDNPSPYPLPQGEGEKRQRAAAKIAVEPDVVVMAPVVLGERSADYGAGVKAMPLPDGIASSPNDLVRWISAS